MLGPDYLDIRKLTEVRTMKFKGREFSVVCNPEQNHATWATFLDELQTAEAWFDVQPGDIVLDIGAAMGGYALPALALGAERVFAWSPPGIFCDPKEAHMLALNLFANGWEDKCTIYSGGLWSSRGYMALLDGPRLPLVFPTFVEALASISGKPGFSSAFQVKTLDMTSEVGHVDWIKMDVEGCEVEVLRGAERVVRQSRPKLYVENHYHVDAHTKEKFAALLDRWNLGYIEIGTKPHGSVSHTLYVPR